MKRNIFTIITAACLALTATAQNNPVATISGNLDVTSLGAATYHTPITVPSGVNGLQPNISLNYNSNAGNGIAGWGFNLNAYSMISRTGRDIVHDGISKPITWDENDNFVLDGQRLMMVKQAGTYLTPGSEYRTEIESYKQITMISSGLSNGSTGFRVQTKDGTIYEYGTTDDSQFYLVDHSTPITMGIMHWLLQKVTDPNGNYMTYFYGNDAANNEYWIDRIEYGGNTNTGNTAMNKIQFTYDSNRPDSRGFQIGGCIAKQTKLLTSITTYTNSVLQNQYSLDYGTFDGTVKKISKLTQTNSQGESLKPTVFNWSINSETTSTITKAVHLNNVPEEPNLYIDLDNDGLSELFHYSDSGWSVYDTSDGINFTPTNNTEVSSSYIGLYPEQVEVKYLVADINNDSKSDIIEIRTFRDISTNYSEHGNANIDVLLNVNGQLVRQLQGWKTGAPNDFDQDVNFVKNHSDFPPLYTYSKLYSSEFFLTQSNTSPKKLVLGEFITSSNTQVHNTKGKYGFMNWGTKWDKYVTKEILHEVRYHDLDLSIKNLAFPYQSSVSIPSSIYQSETLTIYDNEKSKIEGTEMDNIHLALKLFKEQNPVFADFSGAGTEQVYFIKQAGAYIFNNQVKFYDNSNPRIEISAPDGLENTGDFDGDGRTDFIKMKNDHLDIYQSTNKGFMKYSFHKLSAKNQRISHFKIGDFDGDGKDDVFVTDEEDPNNKQEYWKKQTYLVRNFTNNNTTNLIESETTNLGDKLIGTQLFRGISKPILNPMSLNNENTTSLVYMDLKYKFLLQENNYISSIQDGLGNTQTINYGTLSQSQCYAAGSTTTTSANVTKVLYPDFKVVASTSLTNGSNQLSTNYYKYEGLKVNTAGYGLIGFDNTCISSISGTLPTSANDIQTAIDTAFKTTTTYGYDPTYYIPYMTGQTVSKKGTLISSVAVTNQVRTSNVGGFTLNTNKILQPYVSEQTATDHLSGITTTTEYLGFDDQNNPSKIKTTKGGVVKIDDMVYISKGSWCKNKLSDITSTVTYGTNTPYTRSSSYTYDATNGNLLTTVTDPTNADLKVTNTYTYDKFGNQLTVKSSTKGGYRESSNTYYPSGRFIQTKKDIVGNTTTYVWDETKGTLTSQTDRRGTTTYAYDNWKTLTSTILPTGITQYALTSWANDVAGALYKTETSVSIGAPPVTQWYDARGNVIQTKTYYLKSGSPVYQFTEYNKNGSVLRTSSPTYDPNTKTWDKTYGYDSYGRAIAINTAEGINSISYSVNSTTYTKSSGQTKTVNTNTAGWTSSVVDNGKTITYDYYSSGLVKNIYTDATTHYDMEYNLLGNRTKITDPDAGVITSQYNGFGDLTQQINNQSVTTKYTYGGPGGALTLRDRNGEETKYRYDNLGRLIEKVVCAFDRKTYTYDSFDRVTKLVEVIGVKPYTTLYKYDAAGHETTHTYHSGYKTTNTYDDYGQLIDVTDSNQKSIWTSPVYDAKGNLTSVVRGGVTSTSTFDDLGRLTSSIAAKGTNAPIINMGYTYSDGNLSSRTDLVNRLYESFNYDQLDRLKSWNIYNYIPKTGDGPQVPSKVAGITYDDEIATPKGNIIQKSDIGNYQMKYDATRIHALSSIDGKPDSITSSNWDVKYNTFNKPTKITQAEIRDAQLKILSPTKTYNITYGADDQRIQTQSCITYAPQQTTTYTDDYEEVFNNITGGYQLIHYLRGAIFTQRYDKSGTKIGPDSLMFTYHDHQGSLIALVTDSPSGDGGIERYAYDPWGKRRNPADWTEYDKRTKWITHRGYTGHEHIDFMSGLINMNGRVYDPITAQFLSPDPMLQAPGNWLNYNRYAYCMNNPLKYTDPSGYYTEDKLACAADYYTRQETFYSATHYGSFDPSSGATAGGTYVMDEYGYFRQTGSANQAKAAVISAGNAYNNFVKEMEEAGYHVGIMSPGGNYKAGIVAFKGASAGLYYGEGGGILSQNPTTMTFSSLSMLAGATVWGYSNGQGSEFSLASLYTHFQFGGGEAMTYKMSSVNFGGATQKQLGLTGMTVNQIRPVNLFNAGPLNQAALAFGRVRMQYHGNDQFSIIGDKSSRFDFWPLIDDKASAFRNAGNLLGAAINYNLTISPAAILVPTIFGGPFDVNFIGTTTIPR